MAQQLHLFSLSAYDKGCKSKNSHLEVAFYLLDQGLQVDTEGELLL